MTYFAYKLVPINSFVKTETSNLLLGDYEIYYVSCHSENTKNL
jgi:hypothetical protein